MKLFYLTLLLFILPVIGLAQTVSVDDTEENPLNLGEFLFDSGCVDLSNASFSSQESVATFTNNGGDFPLAEGIIIRSGEASLSEGPYTGENLSSQKNDSNDPTLQEISNASGQTSNITDVAFLEFDFTPLSNKFRFNFLFASNEYGQWQCASTDAFAFLLTNLETDETTNLAVIPNSDTPVAVKNIRDNAHNPSCTPQNPDLFGGYNVDNPANSTINMRGYTAVMNASSSIEPGTPYRIRLVIGDSNDADFDSAIFLEAGSFHTDVNLGPDRTLCDGDNAVIGTGLNASEYIHTWKRNGQTILGQHNASLEVTQTGAYKVEITKEGGNCTIADEVVFDDLVVNSPQDISVCNSGADTYSYNLTQNNVNTLGLDPDTYEVAYYSTHFNLMTNNPIADDQLSNYESAGNETIFIKVFNTSTTNSCNTTYSFNLLVDPEIEANQPDPIEVCYSSSGYNIDLNQVAGQILGTQDPADFNISYYLQENIPIAVSNPNNYSLPSGFGTKTVWAHVEDSQDQTCFTPVNFDIIENPLPPVSALEDTIIRCTEFILPQIEHGEYYSESQGNGEHFNPGDAITEDGTYFIYNGPDANGCGNESSFQVTILDNYGVAGTYCDHFTVPEPPLGDFYTEDDGPNGNGSIIPTGTVLTTDQDIYYYVEMEDGSLCRDDAFAIDVHPLPPVDDPADVVTCQSYTLPPLQHGNYFSGNNGNGTAYSAGDVVTSSINMKVFADDGTCTNQNTFSIIIIPDFSDVIACGSYTLPELEAGNYYTQPEGHGEQIPAGTEITNSQTVYVHAETTERPNCTDNLSFDISIKPIPPVDSLDDVLLCKGDSYTLPALENGAYFTEPNGNGGQLYAGDVISNSQDLYIFNENEFCSNETEFSIIIKSLPPIVNFVDIYTCEPYTLPEPTDGNVYTEPNGQGTLIEPGELITSTQTLYIYNQSGEPPYCTNEQEFTVYVYTVDVGNFDDVAACDSYVLPALSSGNYYTEAHGEGNKLHVGTTIDSSQTIHVYEKKGDRFICESEAEFDVVISETPKLPDFDDIERCGNYTLQSLDSLDLNANAGYYWEPNAQSPISEEAYTLDQPGTSKIYVYAAAPGNEDCYDEKSFEVTIHPLKELQIADATICVDAYSGETLSPGYLASGVDPSVFKVDWYFEGELVHTGPNHEAVKAGEYTVETTKIIPDEGMQCGYETAVALVRKSSQPVVRAHLSEDFSARPAIRVEIVEGSGDYIYQLNEGSFQSSNMFYDVKSGIHTVTVKDALDACGETIVEVQVLKYPKFFTPNNDGRNDRWNVKDLANHQEAEIYIYDRYGKFITKIYPYSVGWDGQYNGKNKSSDDYWLKVKYKAEGQNRQFTSHFTLKR